MIGILTVIGIIIAVVVGAILTPMVTFVGFVVMPILLVYLLGVGIALPMAVVSEFKDYKKRKLGRPIGHAFKYSWFYVYTFVTSSKK